MKIKLSMLLLVVLALTSCKKKGDSENNPPDTKVYMNATSGSSWTYKEINSSNGTPVNSEYTVTSTSRDTTINSKVYHIYAQSFGGNQYLNKSGNDYYEFDSIPGGIGQVMERLYLRTGLAVGASWSQTENVPLDISGIPINLTLKLDNTIKEKGISRTVNGTKYQNVIHVVSGISSTSLPEGAITSDIQSYYAEGYGLIENTSVISVNYMGVNMDANVATTLESSVLQ